MQATQIGRIQKQRLRACGEVCYSLRQTRFFRRATFARNVTAAGQDPVPFSGRGEVYSVL